MFVGINRMAADGFRRTCTIHGRVLQLGVPPPPSEANQYRVKELPKTKGRSLRRRDSSDELLLHERFEVVSLLETDWRL